MCLYPRKAPNKHYQPNKSNGGFVPEAKDQRLKVIEIPCGMCIECRKKRGREWQIRLTEELKANPQGYFVTFSFSNKTFKKLSEDAQSKKANDIARLAVKRWRERVRRKTGKSPKHWFATELGGNNTERLHLHGIIFEKDPFDKNWGYGNTYIGYELSQRTINYIVKYITKPDETHQDYIPIILSSPGIGKGLFKNQNTIFMSKRDEYITPTGKTVPLPTYYRRKILEHSRREDLMLEKADKGIRWVNGYPIKEKNISEIQNALEFAQNQAIKMGYKKVDKKNYDFSNESWKF